MHGCAACHGTRPAVPEGIGMFEYRTVFVSDVHLGFRGTRAEEFAAFLKRMKCERL